MIIQCTWCALHLLSSSFFFFSHFPFLSSSPHSPFTPSLALLSSPHPLPSPSSPPLNLLSSSPHLPLLPSICSPPPFTFLSSPQSALLLPSPSFPPPLLLSFLFSLTSPSLPPSLSPSCSRVSGTTTSTITSLRPRKKVLTKHKSKLPRVGVCHYTHPCCYYALPVILTQLLDVA